MGMADFPRISPASSKTLACRQPVPKTKFWEAIVHTYLSCLPLAQHWCSQASGADYGKLYLHPQRLGNLCAVCGAVLDGKDTTEQVAARRPVPR